MKEKYEEAKKKVPTHIFTSQPANPSAHIIQPTNRLCVLVCMAESQKLLPPLTLPMIGLKIFTNPCQSLRIKNPFYTYFLLPSPTAPAFHFYLYNANVEQQQQNNVKKKTETKLKCWQRKGWIWWQTSWLVSFCIYPFYSPIQAHADVADLHNGFNTLIQFMVLCKWDDDAHNLVSSIQWTSQPTKPLLSKKAV